MGGAKIHTRGIDEEGYAANTVELEQLVFHDKLQKENNKLKLIITSYVQMRGSIPVFWQ